MYEYRPPSPLEVLYHKYTWVRKLRDEIQDGPDPEFAKKRRECCNQMLRELAEKMKSLSSHNHGDNLCSE